MVTTYLNGVPSINQAYTWTSNQTFSGTVTITGAGLKVFGTTTNGSSVYSDSSTSSAQGLFIVANDSTTGKDGDNITLNTNWNSTGQSQIYLTSNSGGSVFEVILQGGISDQAKFILGTGNTQVLAIGDGSSNIKKVTTANTTLDAGNGDLIPSSGSTTQTGGFIYIPAAAGAPTGTPTNTGNAVVPLYWDTTDHRLYIYDNVQGGWHYISQSA
jgi:hypothetical protein